MPNIALWLAGPRLHLRAFSRKPGSQSKDAGLQGYSRAFWRPRHGRHCPCQPTQLDKSALTYRTTWSNPFVFSVVHKKKLLGSKGKERRGEIREHRLRFEDPDQYELARAVAWSTLAQ